ncbi:MAG: hypothetical protein AB8D78_07170 [Akkermansiaceae bacterium]
MKNFLRVIAFSFLLLGVAQADIVASFQQGEKADTRVDRLPAISVEVGQAATPFLEAGQFEVKWNGSIELLERQRLYFSFEGKGSASLKIGGEEALTESGELGTEKSKRLRLNPGVHEVEITYTSSEDGSGNFRLYWEEKGMPRQTIPPTVYKTEIGEVALAGELKRHGRVVFAEQNCVKCHNPEEGFGANPMPEVLEIAPLLVGIGERVSEEWLRKWIADPAALKPNTKMPRMVDPTTKEGLQKASDLAAFLVGKKGEIKKSTKPDPELAKEGGVHFHELGCAACHFPLGEEGDKDGTNRVPLNNVASKFLPGQLVKYLKTPEVYHPFSGMPNFRFSEAEVNSLAAFLITESEGKETKLKYEFPEGDAVRGAQVSESLQCGTCHPGSPGGVSKSVPLDQIFKADWNEKGCVSEDTGKKGLPHPNLTDREREALNAFAKIGHESLMKRSPAEFSERQLTSKRCVSCHTMDEQISLLDSIHGSTAGLAAHVEGLNERVDQTRPQLTYIGEMLYTDYLERILSGTVEPRPRPWLGMRMPAFKGHAKVFSEGLSRTHGFAPSSPDDVKIDAEMVKTGEKLVGAEGFGCTTCHGIGDMEATAAFEVGAINFDSVAGRLRDEYYFRWMDHPASVVPSTKMPRYAEDGVSQRGDILEGDAGKQYDAIWQWLHSEDIAK